MGGPRPAATAARPSSRACPCRPRALSPQSVSGCGLNRRGHRQPGRGFYRRLFTRASTLCRPVDPNPRRHRFRAGGCPPTPVRLDSVGGLITGTPSSVGWALLVCPVVRLRRRLRRHHAGQQVDDRPWQGSRRRPRPPLITGPRRTAGALLRTSERPGAADGQRLDAKHVRQPCGDRADGTAAPVMEARAKGMPTTPPFGATSHSRGTFGTARGGHATVSGHSLPTGSRTVKVVEPGPLSRVTLPQWASATAATIDRPRPAPVPPPVPSLRRRSARVKRSKTLG